MLGQSGKVSMIDQASSDLQANNTSLFVSHSHILFNCVFYCTLNM